MPARRLAAKSAPRRTTGGKSVAGMKAHAKQMQQKRATATKTKTQGKGAGTGPSDDGVTKKPRTHRWSNDVAAYRSIRFYQSTTNRLMSDIGVERLVREISQDLAANVPGREPYAWQKKAMAMLKEGANDFVTRIMDRANVFCIHAGRVEISPADMRLVEELEYIYKTLEKRGEVQPIPRQIRVALKPLQRPSRRKTIAKRHASSARVVSDVLDAVADQIKKEAAASSSEEEEEEDVVIDDADEDSASASESEEDSE